MSTAYTQIQSINYSVQNTEELHVAIQFHLRLLNTPSDNFGADTAT